MSRFLLLAAVAVLIPAISLAQPTGTTAPAKKATTNVGDKSPDIWAVKGKNTKGEDVELQALLVKQLDPAPEHRHFLGMADSTLLMILLAVIAVILCLMTVQISGLKSAMENRGGPPR
jgi:hypothetical protein